MQPADIRRRLLKQRGVEFRKLSRKPTHISEMPSTYRKTALMRVIELKFNKKLESLIFDGTIYEVGKKLGVSPSAISKWRQVINRDKVDEFLAKFAEDSAPRSNH